MIQKDIDLIKDCNKILTEEFHLDIINSENKKYKKKYDEIKNFCEEVSETGSNILFKKSDKKSKLPGIGLTGSITYHGIPHNRELSPFLNGLIKCADRELNPPEELKNIGNIKTPALLKLFISPQCTFCPAVVEKLLPLSLYSKYISISVIDTEFYPETAEENNIMSVPYVLYDEIYRWTGNLNIHQVIEILVDQSPENLSSESFERLLSEGDASLVTTMILESNLIFPQFAELLTNEKWSVRLGALVVMEEVAEKNSRLAQLLIEPLLNSFNDYTEPVQGDILYYIGFSGSKKQFDFLEGVLNDTYSDEIKEAAKDAMEEINT